LLTGLGTVEIEASNAESQIAVGVAVLRARLDKVNRRPPMESVYQLLGSSCVQKLPEAVSTRSMLR
jgi:hypothetical protein